jgi:hypothetical protein
MTQISTEHPQHIPYIELTEQGRKISFRKECLEEIEIRRKVNENDWSPLAKNIRTPYIDEEDFPSGTKLSYAIRIGEQENDYILDLKL